MAVELTAKTPPGERLVVLAEALAEELRPAAASHDQDRSYAFEGLETIKASGYLSAPVPVKLGGLGVSSTHDLLVAASRLARGDAALTIGVNMHITYVLNLERRYRLAVDLGNVRNIEALAASLEALAQDGHVYAAAVSEPRQDLIRPETVAAAIDNGWIVTGTKIFCTMSPGADRLYTAVTFLDRQGRESYGYATVPTDAPGVVIHDDWDALGMRASGSNSVTFENVRLPADALRGGFPVGHAGEYMERNLDAGLFHAAAALGTPRKRTISRHGAWRRTGALRPREHSPSSPTTLSTSRPVGARCHARARCSTTASARAGRSSRCSSSVRFRPRRRSSPRPRCASLIGRSLSRAEPAT